MLSKEVLLQRVEEYARRQGLRLGDQLGFGVHGTVFVAESQEQNTAAPAPTAVKVHRQEADYKRERDVYLRLRDNGVSAIRQYHVPELIRYDDSLLILEMTIVTRPYVLDFAGAFLDYEPDFDSEVLADWHAEKREQFGKRWAEVQGILRTLEDYGIFVVDVNPNNIAAD